MIDYIFRLISRYVFRQSGKIRIDPDNLPGLRPPKPAPPLPFKRPDQAPGNSNPSVEDLYKRFVRLSGDRPKDQRRPREGDLF